MLSTEEHPALPYLFIAAKRRVLPDAIVRSGCARVPSWSRRRFVQHLIRQVSGWVHIAQRRDDLLTHEPDRAHELFVLNLASFMSLMTVL